MTQDEATREILRVLETDGRATDAQILRTVDGDRALLQRIKETLILDELAEDKAGIGLVYIGNVSAAVQNRKGGTIQEAVIQRSYIDQGHREVHYHGVLLGKRIATETGEYCQICGKLAKDEHFVCQSCGKKHLCMEHQICVEIRGKKRYACEECEDELRRDMFEGLTLEVGMVLGKRYRLEGMIGRGGMGRVYLAHDLELEEDAVALKFLPLELVGDAKALSDLRKEVRISKKVSHPNVVRVDGLVSMDGFRCLSMEYVSGPSLADLLLQKQEKDERFTLDEVCRS